MKPKYTAHATLSTGSQRQREFDSLKNAAAYAKRIANERGACFVVRKDGEKSVMVLDTRTQKELV